MGIGYFIHLRDDLNFNLSIMAGVTLAMLVSVTDFVYYAIQDDPGMYVYLCATFLFIFLESIIWKNYVHLRKGVDETESTKQKKTQ